MNVFVGRHCLRRVLKDEAEATRKRIQETPCRGEERRQQGPRRPGRVEGGTVRGCHVLQVAAHPCGQSDEARPAGLESQQAQRASSARQQVEKFPQRRILEVLLTRGMQTARAFRRAIAWPHGEQIFGH